MKPYMPMLVIRTKETLAAIELNGMLIGEASEKKHIALPLSDSGDYYVGVYPLGHEQERYYPMVRKLRFQNGQLQDVDNEDVEVYAWPDGLFEVVFTPGKLARATEQAFPFTIDQLTLPDGCIAILYYENGLRLAVEQGSRVRYGVMLGNERTGSLSLTQSGILLAIAGEPCIDDGDVPEGYGSTLVALDTSYRELIRVTGDAVGLQGENIVSFSRTPTLLRHDRKRVFRFKGGKYELESSTLGFFTHTPEHPEPGRDMIRAFCEAVQLNQWEEAFSYLSSALRDSSGPYDDIASFRILSSSFSFL